MSNTLKNNKLQVHVEDELYNIILSTAALKHRTVSSFLREMIIEELPNEIRNEFDNIKYE